MKTKTPQEKKELSYAKDCRNTYSENDKSSRKNIPLRKAKAHRSYRKKVNDILQTSLKNTDTESVEVIENTVKSIRKDNWKKSSDMPLGELVELQLDFRKNNAGKGKTARKKIRETVENLENQIEQESNLWVARAKSLPNISAIDETPEKAVEKLKYLVKAAIGNDSGFDITILINGKLTKPTLEETEQLCY